MPEQLADKVSSRWTRQFRLDSDDWGRFGLYMAILIIGQFERAGFRMFRSTVVRCYACYAEVWSRLRQYHSGRTRLGV